MRLTSKLLIVLFTGMTILTSCSDDEQLEDPIETEEPEAGSLEEDANAVEEDNPEDLTMVPEVSDESIGMSEPVIPEASDQSVAEMQADIASSVQDDMGDGMITPPADGDGADGSDGAMGNSQTSMNTDMNTEAAMYGSYSAGTALYVRCNVLTIRRGPGVEHNTEGYLIFNAEVKVQEQQGKWIKFADGKWVSSKFLTSSINDKPSMP